MNITRLRLRSFRNYDDVSLELGSGLNIIVGHNGQGKTNLLEAIYYLSTTKSHRTREETALIQKGHEFFQLDARVDDKNGRNQYSAVVHKKGKVLRIQGEPVEKISDFIGKLNAVIFSPLDLNLFDSSPGDRRRMMDIELGKISKVYTYFLSTYSRLLKSRNAYLKQDIGDDGLLDALNEQMVRPEREIIRQRQSFVDSLNGLMPDIYHRLSGTDMKVRIVYHSTVPYSNLDEVLDQEIRNQQADMKEKDRFTKVTNSGIHRDDLEFTLDDMPVRVYASQGQKRMIVLALKLALVEMVYRRIGEYPVLLLDDVLSELDENRRKKLIEMMPDTVQTVLTVTDSALVSTDLWQKAHVLWIEKGCVANGPAEG